MSQGTGSIAIRNESAAQEGAEVTRHMAQTAARAAADMFGRDVTVIDLRGLVSYADYFVVASAGTERQTRRIADEVLEKMKEEGYRPTGRRHDGGRPGSAWISWTLSCTSSPRRPATTTAWNHSGALLPRRSQRSKGGSRRLEGRDESPATSPPPLGTRSLPRGPGAYRLLSKSSRYAIRSHPDCAPTKCASARN